MFSELPIVLIVDDEPANVEILAVLLAPLFRVKVANNGWTALDIARLEPQPDLILLDVMMPDIDGYEVCKQLKADAVTLDIPVMFITAAAHDAAESYGLQLGAIDYITKPFNRDVTLLRVQNHLALKQAQDKLRLATKIVETTLEGVVITDLNAKIVDVNNAFCQITGYAREEVLGRTPSFLKSGLQEESFYADLWRTLRDKGEWQGEIWNRNKQGELYPEWLTIATITNSHGRPSHYVGVFTDTTMLKQHEKQLERIAHYDALTGVPNRVLLSDRLHQAIIKAKREQNLLIICYLDLDGFKPVNDRFGHEAGDQVLIESSRRIAEVIRDMDTIARLGGDEFVILLQGINQLAECSSTLDRLLSAIARPLNVNGTACFIGASIGVAVFPLDGDDPDLLLRHADQAMYTAKRNGKNRYCFYDAAQDQQLRLQGEWRNQIRHGLDNREFELFYQPKINLATGDLVGAEALIRWRHPQRGLLLPAEFLPHIQESELDTRLGEWVITQALEQLSQWQKAGVLLEIAINISTHHLQTADFVAYLKQALARHPDLPAHALQIEILETVALEDFEQAVRVMTACQQLGISFALDDFGTGYSSLTYLRHLPAKTIKIDQTFIRDILDDEGDFAIVSGIIALATTLKRHTVAEGIETAEHFRVLQGMGCEAGQGYGIAEPMPAAEFLTWCRKTRDPGKMTY